MEADGFLDLGLNAAAGVVRNEMGACSCSTGWWFAAHDLRIALCNAFGALGGCVKPIVGGDPQASPKEEVVVVCIVGEGVGPQGRGPSRRLVFHHLLLASLARGGTVESSARVELLYI